MILNTSQHDNDSKFVLIMPFLDTSWICRERLFLYRGKDFNSIPLGARMCDNVAVLRKFLNKIHG